MHRVFQSKDDAQRRSAWIAEGAWYTANGEKLDEIYDKLVAIRTRMAKKLGFDNYIPLGYLRMQRNCYDQKDVEAFRASVRENLVPVAEEVCKKQYGDDWYDACRRPIGSRLRSDGVVMTPAVRGTWRWLSSTLLTFEPAESWPAAKEYRFDFSKLSLPVGTKLAATALTLRTKPLSLLSSNVRFWADRTPAGAKLGTLDLRFSSAPDRKSFESRFAMRLPKGLALEKPSFEWTDDGLGVYVRMTVRALPDATGTATFELPGVASRLDQSEQLRPRVAKRRRSARLKREETDHLSCGCLPLCNRSVRMEQARGVPIAVEGMGADVILIHLDAKTRRSGHINEAVHDLKGML